MYESTTVTELESSLFVTALISAALANGLDSYQREAAHLRIVVQSIGCPYGHRRDGGGCELGYPGCACMDDLLALNQWDVGGPHDAAILRMANRLNVTERRLADHRTLMRQTVRALRSLAEGFVVDRVPSKAAGVNGLADLLESAL